MGFLESRKAARKKWGQRNKKRINTQQQLRRTKDPTKHRAAAKRWYQNNLTEAALRNKKFREENPEYFTQYYKAYRESNKESLKQYDSNYHKQYGNIRRERQYGLTQDRYEEMIKRQGGRCAICPAVFDDDNSPCVDHCHTTGKVRGLLCRPCNAGMGLLRDNPELCFRAADYLLEHMTAN